jgi:hypothetical protein
LQEIAESQKNSGAWKHHFILVNFESCFGSQPWKHHFILVNFTSYFVNFASCFGCWFTRLVTFRIYQVQTSVGQFLTFVKNLQFQF